MLYIPYDVVFVPVIAGFSLLTGSPFSPIITVPVLLLYTPWFTPVIVPSVIINVPTFPLYAPTSVPVISPPAISIVPFDSFCTPYVPLNFAVPFIVIFPAPWLYVLPVISPPVISMFPSAVLYIIPWSAFTLVYHPPVIVPPSIFTVPVE